MVFEIIDSLEDAVEINAIAISHNSLLKEHSHKRLCELLGVDVEEFKPFDDVGITNTPTKEEAEQILWDAINKLTGRITIEDKDKINPSYLFTFWLVLLSGWTTLTIIILLNIQGIPHPNPSSAPISTSLCLSVWLFISIMIWIGFLVSYSKMREKDKLTKPI